MTQNRDNRGRFAKSRVIKIAFIIGMIGYALTIAIYKEPVLSEVLPNAPEAQEIADKIIEQKVRELENEILETLAYCESNGTEEPDGAIILDTNKRMSIGRYQWQRESIQYYIQKFEGREITKVEAISMAIDGERITELTRKVLFEEEKGWKNWWNCSKKNNLEWQIKLINKIR